MRSAAENLLLAKRAFAIASVVVAATVAGCGSGDGLVPVQGSVSFEGEPISEGRIQFRMQNEGRRVYAGRIVDGTYEVRTEPGEAMVEIRASRLTGEMDESNPDDPQPKGEMYIPSKYNSRTELTADIQGPSDTEDFSLSDA
jgi:hypothetical protein